MVHGADKPQAVNLLPLLESIFADEEKDPDVSELKNILLALIEDGNRHTWHSHRDGPVWGLDPCARKVKKKRVKPKSSTVARSLPARSLH